MRETSNSLSLQNSQQPKQFRGGEKKVMKKSLSLLVAIAMVFSMFATVVSAADETTTPGQYLNELGVILGNQDGDLKEDQTWKRQDVAVLLSRLLGVEDEAKNADKTHEFTDVTDANYDGYISWAVEEGLFEGKGGNKFGFGAELKAQELYALILRVFGEDTTGDNYADVPELAVEYGFATEDTDFTAVPKRGETYQVIVAALKTEVEPGVTLEVKLGLVEVTELAITKVAQTNKGEITVNFNKAASADEQKELTAKVANGTVEYAVTSKWAEDGKSLVLTSTYLPAATYTVTVGKFAPVEVNIVNEVPTKLEIGATTLQKAAGQDLKVKLFNQFGKEIENPSLNITVFNATYGKSVSVVSGKVDLSSDEIARVKDTVVVNASHAATGLNASKSFEVVAGSSATAITLTAPSPLKDKTRISVSESDIVLPYTLTDQYGGSIKLADTNGYVAVSDDKTIVLSGITFLVSDKAIITHFSVDKDGVLKFKTGTQHGTVVVNAMNPTVAGAFASTSFNVASKADVKTLNLQTPAAIVAGNEEFTVPYSAVDTFDQPIAAKDFSLTGLTFTAVGASFDTGYPKLNAKGELKFKFQTLANDATVHVYVSKAGSGQVGHQQFSVRKDATIDKINGFNIAKNFASNGQVELKANQVTYLDNYGRTQKVADNATVTFAVTEGTALSVITDAGKQYLKASSTVTGEVKVKVTYSGKEATYTFNVIKNEDVKDYAIKSVGTLFAGTVPANLDEADYEKTIELVGKTSGGDDVVLDQASAFDFVTSEKSLVVQVKTANTKVIKAVDAGTSVISAYKGSTKLAQIEVTASKEAPIATTVSFKNAEYTLTATTDFASEIVVKDQYGVELETPENFAGFLSSDSPKVAVVTGTSVAKGPESGTAILTYTTTTGASATTVVYVEPAGV